MFFADSVKIKWKGKDYTCPISMELIKLMESNGVNIYVSATRIKQSGVPPISLVSEIFFYLLNAGGCEVGEQELYEYFMLNAGEKDAIGLLRHSKTLVDCFFPKIEKSDRTDNGEKKS